MGRQRRTFTAQQKAEVVRRHLRDKTPVSELAEELEVQPSQIHQWVNAVLMQAEKAFESSGKRAARTESNREQQIKRLQEKLNLKNEVISELMEENVKAKKANGDL